MVMAWLHDQLAFLCLTAAINAPAPSYVVTHLRELRLFANEWEV